ncbi:hypothetical protein FXN65_14020 [Metapseudomonas lalkuanensis]|uniref:Uncharacterized protein n=1 Tax=Metapseudomonas lalkuanensis TaxID=2604832 RepID=A0A5J6QKS8_9GAMM|nr:hypothetical protein [Pseudomonas lalkuanensis]QEY63124.1 hypothetical protein FXN65_14020 [Pseudomonas lalkuanensis]UCP00796.1 hypothetical protein LF844_13650 [Pseudomonas lalkuanensis]
MNIQLLRYADGRSYVQLDDIQVPFRSERQALDYLERLRLRLAAPHALAEAQSRDTETHQDIGNRREAG